MHAYTPFKSTKMLLISWSSLILKLQWGVEDFQSQTDAFMRSFALVMTTIKDLFGLFDAVKLIQIYMQVNYAPGIHFNVCKFCVP